LVENWEKIQRKWTIEIETLYRIATHGPHGQSDQKAQFRLLSIDEIQTESRARSSDQKTPFLRSIKGLKKENDDSIVKIRKIWKGEDLLKKDPP